MTGVLKRRKNLDSDRHRVNTQEDGTMCKPRRETSEETNLADTSILQKSKKISLFSRPPSLWYFVVAALGDLGSSTFQNWVSLGRKAYQRID